MTIIAEEYVYYWYLLHMQPFHCVSLYTV